MTRWRTAGALAILFVLTAGFYWKLTLTRQWTFLEAADVAIQVRPWLDYQAREFHAGRFPLWDPYEWAGHTLIGQVQPGTLNPLNWILFAMPLRDGHIPIPALHWYWVLIHWLGAVAAFALCRDLGARYVPSILGGAVYGLTGFMGHTDWPQVLMPCIWIPVIVLFFLRVTRGIRPLESAALCGVAMGIAFLGNHHVVPTFTAVVIGAMWAVLTLTNRSLTVNAANVSRKREFDRDCGADLLVCASATDAAWSTRSGRCGSEKANVDVGRRPGGLPHIALFLIVTALVASVQVLPSLEYSHRAIRWAGGPAPTLPGDSVPYSVHREYSLSIRELAAMILPLPARHANPYVGLTAFALALLAIRRNRWLAALALAGVLLAIAAPGYGLIYRFAPMVEKAREPAFAIVIAQAGIAILAALGLNRLRPWAAPIALALFLCEAVYHAPRLSRFDRPGSYFRMQQDQAGIMNWLKARPGWFRVDFDDEMVPYNAGDLYGIEQFGATVSSMPLNTHRNLGRADTPRRYGIRYHVGRAPAHPGQTEVFPSVFEDPGIGEPMWAIHDTPCAAPDRFRLISRYRIDATLACPGLAVVGDPYYPGWRAYLDGRRVPIQEVDGVRAVRAAAGRHTIQFRYRPGSVIWGGTLTLAGLGLAAGAVAHSRRRRAIEAT